MNYTLYKKGLIFDDAPHLEMQLSKSEMKDMLTRSNAYLIRNVYDFDCQNETSFWYVIKDTFDGFAELSSKTRNQIRRAQKTLDIGLVDKQLIIDQGYEVYVSSFQKYKYKSNSLPSRDVFIKALQFCLPGEQFWGCTDKSNGKLIAYAHNSIQDNVCHYCLMKAIPQYLSAYYPYYGLIYSMNEYYLNVLGLNYVSDGARSLTNHSNIQPFLIEKFKFRKAYCMLSIQYTWWLSFMIKGLFPLRSVIKNNMVKALLLQEEMARNSR